MHRLLGTVVVVLLVALPPAIGAAGPDPSRVPPGGVDAAAGFRAWSPDFPDGAPIPRRHACVGEDLSPSLRWSGVPAGTKSLVLVVHDPDAPDPAAPRRDWVHWVVVGLPATADSVPGSVRSDADLPAGARQGRNDFGRSAWGGPCPPVGRHRYFFRLQALDLPPDAVAPGPRPEVEKAIAGHVLGEASFMGTFAKGG